MSHFQVVVAVESRNDLEKALAPFDENATVEEYRAYESGVPADHWLAASVRESSGLDGDAAISWKQIADVHNTRYADDPPMLLDDDSRAYVMSTYNPLSKWDWYEIGGRWHGYFPVDAKAFPRYRNSLVIGRGSWAAGELDVTDHRAAGGPKGLLDLQKMRDQAAEHTVATMEEFQRLVRGVPEPQRWSEFLTRHEGDPAAYPIDRARQDYHKQPGIQRLAGSAFEFMGLFGDDPWETYADPARTTTLIAQARAAAVPGYAVLTLDGRWLSAGEIGWFGMSTHTADSRTAYWDTANDYIDNLDEDTFLIAVDCHI